MGRLQILLQDEGGTRNLVKAGHWMTATQRMKANNFDFHAELESAANDRSRQPIPVQNTAFRMTTARPVVLPKGQTRDLEATFFIPDVPPSSDSMNPATVWLRNTLRARRGGREVYGADEPTTMMPAYQFFFVVLADDPDRYGYLKRLDSIVPPSVGEGNLAESTMHYRVILPPADRRVPLPSQGLTWTPIAYLLWDGLRPICSRRTSSRPCWTGCTGAARSSSAAPIRWICCGAVSWSRTCRRWPPRRSSCRSRSLRN